MQDRAKRILQSIQILEGIPEEYDAIDYKITQALEILDEAIKLENEKTKDTQLYPSQRRFDK